MINKELYQRFTETYLPGQQEIRNDALFSDSINAKILKFCKEKKAVNYRILNCETQVMPSSAFSESANSTGFVMLIVHIAYST